MVPLQLAFGSSFRRTAITTVHASSLLLRTPVTVIARGDTERSTRLIARRQRWAPVSERDPAQPPERAVLVEQRVAGSLFGVLDEADNNLVISAFEEILELARDPRAGPVDARQAVVHAPGDVGE